MCGTGNLQILVWILLVKLRAFLVMVSVCVLYNFLDIKITSLFFFVSKLMLISKKSLLYKYKVCSIKVY